jgi:hypothetical protein
MQFRRPAKYTTASQLRRRTLVVSVGLFVVTLWFFVSKYRVPQGLVSQIHETAVGLDTDDVAGRVPARKKFSEASSRDQNLPEDEIAEPALGREPSAEDYQNLYKKQVDYCGQLCAVDKARFVTPPVVTSVESLKKSYISTPVRCATFFSKRAESLFDGSPLEWPPPKQPPVPITVNGELIETWYAKDRPYLGGTALRPRWNTTTFAKDIALLHKRQFKGS